MNNRPTPETDAFAIKFKTTCGEKYWVPVDIARKLERERDDARRKLNNLDVTAIHSCHNECQRPTCILRRERDEALESLKHISEYGTDEINAAVDLRQKLAQALVERDEAREAWYQMQSSFERSRDEVEKLIRESDEAREAFKEMWRSGDAFLPHVDSETINRWRKAAGWEETK